MDVQIGIIKNMAMNLLISWLIYINKGKLDRIHFARLNLVTEPLRMIL